MPYFSLIGDIDDMAINALSLLKDDTRMLQFKNQARIQASKFDIKQILPMYENLYSRLTGMDIH